MRLLSVCTACASTTEPKVLYYKVGIPIYQCRDCGLGSAAVKEFDPTSYYDAGYFSGGKSDGYSDYAKAGDVLRGQFAQELDLLRKLGAGGGHLLELGCAYGFFLEVAQRWFQTSGVEIADDAVAACRAKGLMNVRQGMISGEALATIPPADVIVMLDVIEHLPSPADALAVAAAKLQVGGLMLITTGDFASLIARMSGKKWRLMTPPQHLWFFTPASLRILGERFGLEMVYMDHPFKKVPFGLIVFQVCRYFSFSPKLPSWTHRWGVPVNLFDAMRIVFRKKRA